MSLVPIIESMLADLETLASSDRAGANDFQFAMESVKASFPRAVGEGKLAAAARMTVASSVMNCVTAAYRKGRYAGYKAVLVKLAKQALEVAPISTPSHEDPRQLPEQPSGWDGPASGPFRKVSPVGILTVSRRPLLPGGDWTGHLGSLPVSFGGTTCEAANAAETFAAWLERARPIGKVPRVPGVRTRTSVPLMPQ